jgi:hypothetical protein
MAKRFSIDEALQMLLEAIERDVEFPDACSKVAMHTGVSYHRLREAYDAHCEMASALRHNQRAPR